MLQFLEDTVRHESPTSEKSAVDKCSSFVIKEFRKSRAKITRIPQKKIGDFYLVEYPPSFSRGDKQQILVLTHIDTVWPLGKIKSMPFYSKGNKIFGPGVLDMKAGLVIAAFSLKALHELHIKPQKKIAIFINSSEEVANEDSDRILAKLAKKSAYALCLEPAVPGGALKMQRKGRLVVNIKAIGKAAHGGTPEKGINAIDELMLQLQSLQKLRSDQVTINTGLIEGGKKVNIVADEASATLDIRFWKNYQKEKIINALKKTRPSHKGAKIYHSFLSVKPPMEKTPVSSELFLRIKQIAQELKMDLEPGKSGGGSDASIVANLGVPTVDGLGPDGDGIHAEHEHLLLPSLIERTVLFTKILSLL